MGEHNGGDRSKQVLSRKRAAETHDAHDHDRKRSDPGPPVIAGYSSRAAQLRDGKFCNLYHLRDHCPSGDDCKYKHGERLGERDRSALAMVAKRKRCDWSTHCSIMDCIYGHW